MSSKRSSTLQNNKAMTFIKSYNLIILISVGVLAAVYGCKKDIECNDVANPECPNYNICQATPPPNAGFEIFQRVSTRLGDSIFAINLPIIDTTFPGPLYFRASTYNDNYSWKIGSDSRVFDEREVKLTFREEISDPIAITLTVDRELPQCPGRELESSMVSKDLVLFYSQQSELSILGEFVGNNESESMQDPFTIDFAVGPDEVIHLRNFPRGAENGNFINDITITNNYKSFLFTPTLLACCSRAHGIGRLSANGNELIIEYKIYDGDSGTWKKDVWTGTRIE